MGTRSFGCGLGTLVLLLSGCFSVTDLGRFHTEEGTAASPASASGQYLDLKFSMLGMKPHVGQVLQYRVIDAMNRVQSRGVIHGLPASTDVTVFAPAAVPKINGPYRLDFFADVNLSGGYDGLGSVISDDHAWRIQPLADYPADSVPPVDGMIQVTFVHSTSFTDIDDYPSGTKNPAVDTGLAAVIHLKNLPDAVGKLGEIRVAERATGHVVALYRVPQLLAADLDAKIEGAVDVGTDYDVDVYLDANGDEKYDNPATSTSDRVWRVTATSTATGLDATIDASLETAKIDVGPP
jgi:hypothetical protein